MLNNVKKQNYSDFIKSINTNDIAYDEQGRVIIRTSGHEKKSGNKVRYYISGEKAGGRSITSVLKNQLLHPADRIVRKPLTLWARELLIILRDMEVNINKQKCASLIAETFNGAALIHFSAGDIKSARELCYSQIQMFIDWSRMTHNRELLKYVFQPWINLSRIDRMDGQFHDAMHKLKMLDLTHTNEIVLGNNKVMTQALRDVIDLDHELGLVIKTCSIVEPIKVMLTSRCYAELLNFVENKKVTAAKQHQSILYEAQAIALANMGKIHNALDLLVEAQLNASPAYMHIFNLREWELRSAFMSPPVGVDAVERIMGLVCRLLKSKYINVNDIMYGLHAASVMREFCHNDAAVKLLYHCLEAATSINDEALKAECLIALYEMVNDPEGRRLVENLMIEHFYKTQYISARNKMQTAFADLKHVESKYDGTAIKTLFEDLLLFSSRLL